MLNFFKNFGKGVLYVLVLPFLLVGMALYGVVAFFVFIFLAIKGLVLFFTGRSLYEDLPEDKEAKKRIAIANGTYQEEEASPSEPIIEEMPNEEKETNIDNDPFYIPEYLKTEEDRKALEEQNASPLDDFLIEKEDTPTPVEEQVSSPIIEEEIHVEESPKEEIIVQKSPQNDSFLEISDENDDEEEDDHSGVDIKFD